MTGEQIQVLPDPEACAAAAATFVATTLTDAVARRGVAHWATTGGSTPAPIYRNLALPPLRDEVPWPAVHLWWGDERYVPPDHRLSNAHVAAAHLLQIGATSGQSGTGTSGTDVTGGRTAGVMIPADQVHMVPTAAAIADGSGPQVAAERYAAELIAAGPDFVDGVPAFDLVFVGVGPDGHLLSVFPGSATFDRPEPVLAVPAPTHVEPHVERITLHPRIVSVARSVLVVIHGASKAEILATVLGEGRDERRWPAQLALREGATWIVDEAAAAKLRASSRP
ncbi:MAG TPA: 6-phosphogluconolactonase [Candidatus Limnocylindrales bacterium]|nr:6-phosphogluconolactonase [Candidatus Limnocylindrales bacterium]